MSELVATRISLAKRLEQVDLVLRPGELTCLIGANGSGKTSLIHALAGIGGPEGSVLLGDIDLRRLSPARRSRILSYLPASRDIAWPLSARDVVAIGLEGGDAQACIANALELMELTTMADRRVDQLSTGERSRVLIARALAAEPQLLLLDEPTANLDPHWQLRLMDHLALLAQAQSKIILVALHDLEAARRYADRLLIMNAGRIAADGDAGDLLSGNIVPEIFGIAFGEGGWRPISPSADRLSSP
jgi:iron complex transport system ATP-binding protein